MTHQKIKVSQLPDIPDTSVATNDTDILHILIKDGDFFNGKQITTGNLAKVILERNRNSAFNEVTASSLLVTGSTTINGNLNVSGDIVADGSLRVRELIVSEVSRSVIYESGSTKFGDTLDDTHTFTGSLQVSGSIILNNTYNLQDTSASFDTRITNQENFSSSLNADFVTDAELVSLSSSFENRITNQEDFSSSLDTIFATDADLTNLSSSIVSTITTDSSSFETRIISQEDFSSSLDTIFVTDADLTNLSSSIVSTITIDSSSFETRIVSQEDFSSSYSASNGNAYISESNQNATLGDIIVNEITSSNSVQLLGLSYNTIEQLGLDIDGEATGDNSGESVSMNGAGNRVAIGAPYNTGSANGSGHTRIYELTGSNWSQLGTDIDGEAVGDGSGRSVSMNRCR